MTRAGLAAVHQGQQAAPPHAPRTRVREAGRSQTLIEDTTAALSDEDRGLHFICLCGNIARQFEFVQHTWVMNSKFDELYDDQDPVLGRHGPDGGTFTVQAPPVRRRFTSLPRFVTVRGGAYLFLPGIRALRYLTSFAESG